MAAGSDTAALLGGTSRELEIGDFAFGAKLAQRHLVEEIYAILTPF